MTKKQDLAAAIKRHEESLAYSRDNQEAVAIEAYANAIAAVATGKARNPDRLLSTMCRHASEVTGVTAKPEADLKAHRRQLAKMKKALKASGE